MFYFNWFFGIYSGITDLYVHVFVDNEAIKNLYMKNSFVYEK